MASVCYQQKQKGYKFNIEVIIKIRLNQQISKNRVESAHRL